MWIRNLSGFRRRTFLQGALPVAWMAPPSSEILQRAFEVILGETMPPSWKDRTTAALLLDLDYGPPKATLHSPFFYEPRRPCGSLIKPFTILAYLSRRSRNPLPEFVCPPAGRSEEIVCWNPQGHGLMTMEQALAHSCNYYFYQLARDISPADFSRILSLFQLEEGSEEVPRFDSYPAEEQIKAMTGNSRRLRTYPIRMAYAYAALFNGGRLFQAGPSGEVIGSRTIFVESSSLALVRRGMRLSAREGTGRAAGSGSPQTYAKTGTHRRKEGSHSLSELEGWCVAIDGDPGVRLLAMTYVQPGRGATEAAPLAAKALAAFRRVSSP